MTKNNNSNFAEGQSDFWGNEYPRLSAEEKVNFWTADIHRGMRAAGEYGLDEYSMFTAEWYDRVLKNEPNFDKIMLEVIPMLGMMIDPVQYYSALEKPLPPKYKKTNLP